VTRSGQHPRQAPLAEARTFVDDIATCNRPNPDARLRLFCFPFAGGGPWIFNSWADKLPPDIQREIELWSVRLPGRESRRREPLFTELPPLLAALTPPISSLLTESYAFFGHSMGALVSFELACELRSQGAVGPVHMIVSGHRAPRLQRGHHPVHHLSDREILVKLRRLGGTPDEVMENPALMRIYLPLLRADFAVCEKYIYRHREPLDCSVTALGGVDDPQVSREELSAWRSHTCGPFSFHMFPGGHFFLQSAQRLVMQILAEDLRRVIRRIPRGPRPAAHELPPRARASRASADRSQP
jgi:medium-chain acyl-[acyl-carrier-protein] hydrolase